MDFTKGGSLTPAQERELRKVLTGQQPDAAVVKAPEEPAAERQYLRKNRTDSAGAPDFKVYSESDIVRWAQGWDKDGNGRA